ncbi:MAG: methyltransferase domain-containing protein [Thermogemmatispora sp.]|uniref:class I SAM-dependent methyltransferase n=1 Tax=Thermogemmatispora sp. TaxID=1968838 RepID=UPI00262190F3|nr:class I SAM-dependent methyltransferase [Thermogemmatispora sp.]MBX5459084.1 methyltransferase domain-containing protein [Thermogemmatispora sp.]
MNILHWLKQLWRGKGQRRGLRRAAPLQTVAGTGAAERGPAEAHPEQAAKARRDRSSVNPAVTTSFGSASPGALHAAGLLTRVATGSWPGSGSASDPGCGGKWQFQQPKATDQLELVGAGSTLGQRQELERYPTVRLPQPPQVAAFARRYLIDTDYLLPKDLIEANRLDFQHFYLKHVLKSNYLAPLDKGRVRSILDVGCGTGRWVIEMARAFPQARVYGIDLEWSTPLQKLPPNVSFLQGDVLRGLPFPEHTFDYVHQRLLAMGIPAKRWPFLLQELQRVTAPGGWIELFEGGDTFVNAGPALRLFIEWYRQASKRAGYDPALMDRLGNLFQDLGLHHVRLETLSVPVGPWGRHEGVMLQKNLMATFPGLFPLLQQQLNIEEEQFNTILREINREMEMLQVEYQYYVVYGQK